MNDPLNGERIFTSITGYNQLCIEISCIRKIVTGVLDIGIATIAEIPIPFIDSLHQCFRPGTRSVSLRRHQWGWQKKRNRLQTCFHSIAHNNRIFTSARGGVHELHSKSAC